MRNRFGYDVLSIPDVQVFRDHEDAINPGVMIFFQNQLDEAKRTKAKFKDCNVVVRYWPDSNTVKDYADPARWVDAHKNLIGTGLILQTVNEGGFNKESVDWHIKLLTYLKQNKIDLKVGILGLSVGTPKPEEWPMADDLFRLVATMRNQVYLILHEYFGGVVTSGFIGGDPNDAGVAHGQPGGTNLIPKAAWPEHPQALTLWHIGRYLFLKHHLNMIGCPMPQVIIGEFGADFTGDIAEWLKSLHSTQGQYDTVDGWRDLWATWQEWYPGIDVGTDYMTMAAYADNLIYDENIVGIAFFAYGIDPNWLAYRTDPELNKPMEVYAYGIQTTSTPLPMPDPVPPVVIPPVVVDRANEFRTYIQKALDSWK